MRKLAQVIKKYGKVHLKDLTPEQVDSLGNLSALGGIELRFTSNTSAIVSHLKDVNLNVSYINMADEIKVRPTMWRD